MSSRKDTLDVPAPSALLHDLMRLWRRGIELELRVASPATVLAYDATTQTATIELASLPVRNVEGVDVPQTSVVIQDVPVCWPRGTAAYVTMPLASGATGHAVFMDRSLALWRKTGVTTDPISGRTHALGDAIFEPGLHPNTDPISPPTDATATVVEGPLVKCGRGAVDFALLGTTFLADLNTFLGTFSGALVTLQGTSATDPGAAAFATTTQPAVANLIAALANHISTKVQIE